jgi:hypothetical protein
MLQLTKAGKLDNDYHRQKYGLQILWYWKKPTVWISAVQSF